MPGRSAGLKNLDLADFDRIGALWAFCDFKRHFVSLAKIVKCDIHELVGVEKEIFFLSFDGDKPETFVGQTGYCSFLHIFGRTRQNGSFRCRAAKNTPHRTVRYVSEYFSCAPRTASILASPEC